MLLILYMKSWSFCAEFLRNLCSFHCGWMNFFLTFPDNLLCFLVSTLKIKPQRLSSSKWVYSVIAEEFQFRTCKLWWIIKSKEQSREVSFIEERRKLRGVVFDKSSSEREREFGIVASHWLKCGGFSLAGLLPG